MLRTIAFVAGICLLSCQSEIVETIFEPDNAHEAYTFSLEQAGLDQTYLGQAWMTAAQNAFDQPIEITAPAEEAFYFSDREASSRCYQFGVRRGEEISISLSILDKDLSDTSNVPLFVDLFRVDSAEAQDRILVASMDRPSGTLEFEPRQDATYLLRIQHEILAGGRFALRLERGPRLSFPVQGGKNYDIGSFFGDPRDGGRRLHHGVDIFAKRHTPILAPCDGHIRFAGEKGLGGKVVWMRNQSKRITLYFAHLHTIIAEDGMNVKTGDTLGTVGNTGNAITTPPHLHFGIYANGPIDPYPFVAYQKSKLKPMMQASEVLGRMHRTKRRCRLWNASSDIKYLSANQWVTTTGYNDKFMRIQLPDLTVGMIARDDIEPLSTTLTRERLPASFLLREDLDENSITINRYTSSDDHKVLALSDEHLFIRAADGYEGWISAAP